MRSCATATQRPAGLTKVVLREEIEARGRHVLEFGRHRRAQAREFGQRRFVVVSRAQMAVGHGARRTGFVRIEHGDAIAHGLSGKAEHAAELAATDHAKPCAGQNR